MSKSVYLFAVVTFLLISLATLHPLSLTTDELLEYQGVVDHLRFAVQVLRGGKPDLHDAIVYNLENYGIVAKLPAALISRWIGIAEPAGYEALAIDATRQQLYFRLSHLTTILLGLASSLLLVFAARRLKLQPPWAAGLILLLTPRFIGDSLFNIKDIPFAFFYLLYSISLLLRLRRPDSAGAAPARLILFSALAAGLMGSMKIVALAPVLISETLLAVLLPRRCRWLDGLHIGIDALLLSLVFTPSSWLEPLRFLNGAIKLFRSHDWPGGTWWHGEFLSRVQDPQHWSTGGYLVRWLPSVTPLWILLLALLGIWHLGRLAFAGARAGGDPPPLPPRHRQPGEAIVLFLPFLLQLLLLPALAVIGNANLYDGVRHVLFVYPPLALLAALGFDRLCRRLSAEAASPRLKLGLGAVAVLVALTILDLLTLFPYAYVYVNEPMRFFLNPANTAYDYWVYAGTDASRAALKLGRSAAGSVPRACIASVDLPDPLRAMLAPSIRAASCGGGGGGGEAASGRPVQLRLESGQRAQRASCRSVSRWQWPWFSRTLASACLEPVAAALPGR